MKLTLLAILTLFASYSDAAPRDVVFSWENPSSNANFPPLFAAIYEVGNPNTLIAEGLTANEYATTLPDGVGERKYTVTYYYTDASGKRQESDTAIPVSVYFRPNAPNLIVR